MQNWRAYVGMRYSVIELIVVIEHALEVLLHLFHVVALGGKPLVLNV